MKQFGSGLQRFFEELRRRRVLRVAAIYAVAGWAVVEVSDTVAPLLYLPPWTATLVLVLVLLAFPVVLILAWFFDLTTWGLEKTRPENEAPIAAASAGPSASDASADEAAGESPPASRTSDLLFRRIAVAGAIVVLAGAGIAFIVLGGDSGSEIDPGAIAVLPFTVRGGEEVDVLAEGMVELLGTKLDGLGDFRSTDARAVLQVTEDEVGPAEADAIARRLGAGHYVAGSVLEFGGTLRLQAGVYAVGEPDECLGQASAEGPVASFLDLVDQLSAELLTTGGFAPPGRMPRIAAMTTESLPALKAFLEGERAIRAARYAEAIARFEEAVEADTAFALAHYRLAVAAWWEERVTLGSRALQAARRHADRLSSRDRDLVDAFYAMRSGRHAEAEQRYRTIVRGHPDDIEAWYELAEVIIHNGYYLGYSPFDSRDAFERAVSLDTGHGSSLFHLSNLAAAAGDVRLLDSLTRKLRGQTGGARDVSVEGQWAFAVHDSAAMAATLEAFRAGNLEVYSAYFATLGAHNLDDEREIAAAAIEGLPDAVHPLIINRLAQLLTSHGRRTEALAELEQAEKRYPNMDPVARAMLASQSFLRTPRGELERIREDLLEWDPRPVLTEPVPWDPVDPHAALRPHARTYALALVENRLGRPDEALRLARELEFMAGTDRVRGLTANLVREIRGRVALEQGRPDEALDTIMEGSLWEEASWDGRISMLFAQTSAVLLRADALNELGRSREAIHWYRALIRENRYLPYLHYRSAQAYEALGDRAGAALHYARFVHLWEDADPELQPMVQQARERITTLVAEGEPIPEGSEYRGEW